MREAWVPLTNGVIRRGAIRRATNAVGATSSEGSAGEQSGSLPVRGNDGPTVGQPQALPERPRRSAAQALDGVRVLTGDGPHDGCVDIDGFSSPEGAAGREEQEVRAGDPVVKCEELVEMLVARATPSSTSALLRSIYMFSTRSTMAYEYCPCRYAALEPIAISRPTPSPS